MLKLRSVFHSISVKTALAVMASTACAVVLTALIGWFSLNREIEASLQDKTNWSLRVAAEAFMSYFPDYTIDYDANGEVLRLKGPEISNFSDHDAVDRITRINKGTATVFRFDATKNDFVRLTTSVKKADGTRAVGTVLGNTGVVFPVIMKGDVYKGVANILGVPYQTGYMPIHNASGKAIGILYIGVGKLSELYAATDHLYQNMLVASGIVLLLASLCGFLFARQIVAPIAKLSAITQQVASNTLGARVPFTERKDEIGSLAISIEKLNNAVTERDDIQQEQAMRSENDTKRARHVEAMIADFRTQISQTIENLDEGVRSMDVAAQDLTRMVSSAASIADASQLSSSEASESISEVATASDQLSRSIMEIAARAEETSHVIDNAVNVGKQSRLSLDELGKATGKIGEVVQAIRAIAEQTNLLALNATIEAARAGEAGRGFAVVAGEVKQLADQTAHATAEVSQQVTNIQNVSQMVVKGFTTLISALASVNEASHTISSAVVEQGAATSNIARNATLAAASADVLNGNVLTVTNVMADSARSVEALETLSSGLKLQSRDIVRTVDDFLGKVAA